MIILTLIYLIGCNSNKEKHNKISEIDLKQANIAFAELKETLKNENGKLWNLKLDGPILLINRDTRIIISNEPDDKGELIKQGDYYVGIFPENMNIANTAVDWNGKRWTMVAFPLPETKEERLNLLIHESFHRIQPLIGFDSLNEIQSAHLDTKEGRIYMKLELEALKKALSSEKSDEHLKNALLFRQYRQQLFPEAKQAENSLEINEGIAEFTGSILSGRSDTELRKHFASSIDKFYGNPTFVRSFAYYTIPVYGYFMQKSDDKWNLKINKKINMTDFIFDFYNVKRAILDNEEIMQMGKLYDIDSVIESEKIRESNRLKQIDKYKVKFLGDSIISIGLENMHIGFNPSNLVPLDSFGTVYPNLRITDNWGILEVDSCGALVSRKWNNVTIGYPEVITDTLISGKGWKLKLNDSWKLEKKNIKYILTKK